MYLGSACIVWAVCIHRMGLLGRDRFKRLLWVLAELEALCIFKVWEYGCNTQVMFFLLLSSAGFSPRAPVSLVIT